MPSTLVERQVEWQTDLNSDAGVYTVRIDALNTMGEIVSVEPMIFTVTIELNCSSLTIVPPAGISTQYYLIAEPEVTFEVPEFTQTEEPLCLMEYTMSYDESQTWLTPDLEN